MVAPSTWRIQGNASEFWQSRDREVLNDGPARCGKTLTELLKFRYLCETYPGTRLLLARDTRKSLTESACADFENKVLGPGSPIIGRMRRSHRDAYRWPNGSAVILHGLDTPDNLLSMELDGALVVQGEQVTNQATWDGILSRLSGRACGFQQAILDVNPAGERHWILRRARETICLRCSSLIEPEMVECKKCKSTAFGKMRHLRWKHCDNPLLYDIERMDWTEFGVEYLTQILGRLRGVRRKRLLEGLWVSEEGQVFEDWDPDVHRITGKLKREGSIWVLTVTSPGWSIGNKDMMREARVPLDWFGAGADFGFSPHPGTMEVFGYDRHGRRFRVVEVYKTKMQLDWWASVAEALHAEFGLRYIAVDPSAGALRDAFNLRLGSHGGRGGPMIAIPANNVIRQQEPDLAGIDLMRWGLKDPQGMVRTFFLRDAQRYGMDADLREAGKPTCVEEEIPELVFERRKSTDEPTEKPDPGCADDGIDSVRYEGNEGWGHRMAQMVSATLTLPANSKGAIHRTQEKLAKARAWAAENG